MLKLVGFIFGAIAGLVAAAWLYGGSTWGPGFAAKEAVTPGIGAPQFRLSGEPPPQPPFEPSPPASAETPAAPPPFNTGGNPNVEPGAGPNWGLGYGVGRNGK